MKTHVMTFLALALFTIPAGAWAMERGVARISLIEGDVQVRMADGDDWAPAAVNTPLEEGDSVWAPDGSRAEIEIQDGTRIRLDSRSSLDLVDVGDDDLQFHLGMGHAYIRTGDMRNWSYQFDLTESTVRITDRGRLRLDISPDGEEEISVIKGSAYVEGYGSKTRVRTGEMLSLDESRSDILPLDAPDPWEKWNRKRDQALNARGDSYGYLPDELRVYDDELSRSGQWVDVQEYGRVWRPTVIVTDDWAPYRVGRWVWRDGDYVWISYESWGWVPYHYGRWVVTARWGWCWVPPRRGDVFWAPAYVGWVTTPRHVGWVPLAPGEIYYGRGNYGRASVNVTNVTNVSVNTTIVYRNQSVSRNALSVVPRDSFTKGRLNFVKARDASITSERISPSRPAPPPRPRELRMPLVKPIPPAKLPPPQVASVPARELKHLLPRVQAPATVLPARPERAPRVQKHEQAPSPAANRGNVQDVNSKQDRQPRIGQEERQQRGGKNPAPPDQGRGGQAAAVKPQGGHAANQPAAARKGDRPQGGGLQRRIPKNVWKVRPKQAAQGSASTGAPARPPKEKGERKKD